MLQPFYKGGAYEKILNENVDSALFDETFIVFEVDASRKIKKLFPIVTLIIMDVFLQKMRIKKTRKVLVIEEAWKAIASPLMAEYIKFMYKTARKFWASVGVVTQEIQDIIGSEIVKEAIINNSDVVMLLDQSKFKERFDEIRKILGLTEVDCKKIFTINRLENKDGRSFFREVFIRRGNDQRRVRRGRAARVLHDLHDRTGGKGGTEALQEGTSVQPSGSYRGILPGLGCQRYREGPAFCTKSKRDGACAQPPSRA